MVGRFGSREICDVTFKPLAELDVRGHKIKAGQPFFVIDTATASSMEQATTTVYAQGGRGYNRLIAWEGEKTMTFTVTDALLSPLGLKLLTGAGLAADDEVKHVHVTYDVKINAEGKATISLAQLNEELGSKNEKIDVCFDTVNLPPYATVLDSNGAVVDWVSDVKFAAGTSTYGDAVLVDGTTPLTVEVDKDTLAGKTIKVDFYVMVTEEATHITIEPDDFGGFFYVEADTLYRNQNGEDLAATLTFPKVKVQSGFTISMAPTGDPSTFDFVMDAFPAYTYFDQTKKVIVDMTIINGKDSSDDTLSHSDHSKN